MVFLNLSRKRRGGHPPLFGPRLGGLVAPCALLLEDWQRLEVGTPVGHLALKQALCVRLQLA